MRLPRPLSVSNIVVEPGRPHLSAYSTVGALDVEDGFGSNLLSLPIEFEKYGHASNPRDIGEVQRTRTVRAGIRIRQLAKL